MENHAESRSFVRSHLLWQSLACLSIFLMGTFISGSLASSRARAATTVPSSSHVVIVMEENHSYADIIGSSSAPYLNSLASEGAVFTQSFAITHPSEPNYLALFSGDTQGITDDSCPHSFSGPDLGSEIINAGSTFSGYSESMPRVGYTGCTSASLYARKHNPWVNFSDVPSSDNLPWTSFPTDYNTLPTISFVIPNLQDDMHDGTIQQGDTWLQQNLDGYVQWAQTNNSLLIVTWDEDDGSQSNQIPTIFVGQMVKAGQYSETIDHYSVLRTLEDMYGLAYTGNAATATSITDCWQ
jgi:phosphatidylinositol-3-phosphatase